MQPEVNLLDSHVIEPQGRAKFSVIWLHGLGADGYDFAPIVPQLKLKEYQIRFIFPHAPSMPVTLNNGYVMPAWFDIYGLDKNSREDSKGILQSSQLINKLIEAEHSKGIAYGNIMLIGFSQGSALALYTGLKFEHKLAGIAGLSGYLPRFDQSYSTANKSTPIMLAHGKQDPVVLSVYGAMAKDRLQELGHQVSWYEYNMEHQVCMPEIQDLASFMRSNWKI